MVSLVACPTLTKQASSGDQGHSLACTPAGGDPAMGRALMAWSASMRNFAQVQAKPQPLWLAREPGGHPLLLVGHPLLPGGPADGSGHALPGPARPEPLLLVAVPSCLMLHVCWPGHACHVTRWRAPAAGPSFPAEQGGTPSTSHGATPGPHKLSKGGRRSVHTGCVAEWHLACRGSINGVGRS